MVAGANSPGRSTNPSSKYSSFKQDLAAKKVPIFEPENLTGGEFLQKIKQLKPELFVCIGYPLKLTIRILEIPRSVVNFHASLLPAYRGRPPVFWALRNNERYSGLTIHEMDENLDEGDIYYQKKVKIKKDDTVFTLYERIMKKSSPLVRKLVIDFSGHKLEKNPQSRKNASYYSSTTEDDFRICWDKKAEDIKRWISITPGRCFTEIGEKKAFLVSPKIIDQKKGKKPGTVVSITDTVIDIATKDNIIQLEKVMVGNREINASKFSRRLA
ncbi:MAG: methionyl-tRNA formyltransferase [Candidatus Humimicrobiaceae bacterium]